ncbi:Niemann-Pick-like protein [Acrasis kona]|uniref:Niemann-Pick-like protein n=1 Tax=Acrasis kona TaxID=1008807 RepID=A0AAW2ZJL9_9EUKA
MLKTTITVLALVSYIVAQECVMMADGSYDASTLTHQTRPWKTPIMLTGPAQEALKFVCPTINSTKPVCCNSTQLVDLQTNFIAIDIGFGTTCPSCAVSLKRMFCDFACSPEQSHFVKIESLKSTNYVATAQFATTTKFQSELWESCKDTGIGPFKNRVLYGNVENFLSTLVRIRRPDPNINFVFNTTGTYDGQSVPCETTCSCEYCVEACRNRKDLFHHMNKQ